MSTFDPVCLVHGKRKSEHHCLYCCLCFKSLAPDECWTDEEGQKWDVCIPCKEAEEVELSRRKAAGYED